MNFKRFLKLAVLCMSVLIIFACESVDEPAQESQVNNEAVTTEAVTTEESVDKLSVLATTPMIAEYVRQVGNDNIDLSILMPYSADPHSFEASPQDAIKIADADIVFYVGLKYESANLVELLENSVASPDALIEIGPSINPIEFSEEGHDDHEGHGHDDHEGHGHDDDKHKDDDDDDHDGHDHDKHKDDDDDDHDGHDHDKHKDDDDDHDGHDHDKHKDDDDDHDDHDHDKHKDDDVDHDDHDDHEGHDDHDGHDGHEGHDHGIYDPHFWFDPIRVSMAVDVIKDELVKFDTANESSYESAASDYIQSLEALDASVTAMIDTIPVENRKIITTHEALGYLEARYGIEVLTTIIPSLNSEDGITPQSLKNAIDVIEKNHIEVMFLEAESSSQYSEVIEQETGISLVSGLWVETLQENQSYVDWMNSNVTIIVNNLPKEVDDDHAGHDHDKHKDDDDHDGHDHDKHKDDDDHDGHDHDDDDHDDDDHDDDDHDKKDK